jgi:hypothetical protein
MVLFQLRILHDTEWNKMIIMIAELIKHSEVNGYGLFDSTTPAFIWRDWVKL